MKNVMILVLTLILGFISLNFSSKHPPDYTLVKYYSAILTLNLNHAMESSKIIYHLSMEPAFRKDLLEDELNKIERNVFYANDDIADMVLNLSEDQKIGIDKYLKNIDQHFAQISVDMKQIRSRLNKEKPITHLISDIYYQIKKAETEDHTEIKKIQHLKTFDEPVLIINKED
jgi:hypothetical protein